MKIKIKIKSGILEYRDILHRLDDDGKNVYVIEDVEDVTIEE